MSEPPKTFDTIPEISMFSSHSVMITGGTFTQHIVNSRQSTHDPKGPHERLNEATAPNAFHNSGERRDPPKCHRNTRVAVLQSIMDWVVSGKLPIDELIQLLYGPAGAGKSAIAQSIADLCYEQNLLLASFFFSKLDPTRNHARSLFATISYQVAEHFPSTRDCIMDKIDRDPLIFKRSLEAQIESLVLDPLKSLIESNYFNEPKSRRLILIDGLDECVHRKEQVQVLNAISDAFRKHNLPLLFLIASRPDHNIMVAFRSDPLKSVSLLLPLDNQYRSSIDIELYLRDKLTELKANHPFRSRIPHDWPSQEVIRSIAYKSSGQFIYASTVIKFVSSSRHIPTIRLDIMLGIRPAIRDMPFAELDALYMHILSSIDEPGPVLQILAFYFLSEWKCSVEVMETILCLTPGDVEMIICDLGSIIRIKSKWGVPHDDEHSLHIFHASLEDFLLDKSRSGDFYIDTPSRHTEFAHLYCQCLGRERFSGADYILSNLSSHVRKALPTPELRNDIMRFVNGGLNSLRIANESINIVLKDITEKFGITAEELHFSPEKVTFCFEDPSEI